MKFQSALVAFIFASLPFFYVGISVYVERGGLKAGKIGSLIKNINETSFGGFQALGKIISADSGSPNL